MGVKRERERLTNTPSKVLAKKRDKKLPANCKAMSDVK